MLENLYTTKMSMDKKKLQNRFSKIRSKNGRTSKFMALIIFVAILIVMVCVTIIIAARVNSDEYAMTENEFADFVNRPIGAVMADLDYVDDNKLVFHYGEGFFIDNILTEEIDYAINLKKLNIAYNQQGSSVLEIKIDKDGKYAYLSTVGPADEIKGFEKYIINLDSGEVKKGSMPEKAELFTGMADTLGAAQNPIGWYSNNCIVSEDKTYYLSSQSGTVGDIQLVTIHHKDNDYTETKYVFSKDYVSVSQQKQDLIQATLSDDEEILVNSVLSWEVNADIVKLVFNKLSETRQMPYIDIKDGDYDVVFYQIWKNDEATPRLFVIDNYNMKLIFSMSLNKDEYFEINKLVYEAKEQNIKIYTPDDIKDIINVELVAGGIKYPLAVTNAHTEIEKAFSSATKIKMDGTACPFDADLIFTRKDGEKGKITIATDSCAVFKSGDTYYDYSDGDNSMLLGYFGLDVNTVIDLTTINKSYMDNSEIAVRNFFTAFDKSDLETMKTLVTNEFIAQGYIGDYGMCYGMTRATLETCSVTNVKEFLTNYFAKSENEQLTLSENDIELLKRFSDELAVYTVTVTAESNIKGEIQPPFKRFFNVICKKQDNGSWLVHKLV